MMSQTGLGLHALRAYSSNTRNSISLDTWMHNPNILEALTNNKSKWSCPACIMLPSFFAFRTLLN